MTSTDSDVDRGPAGASAGQRPTDLTGQRPLWPATAARKWAAAATSAQADQRMMVTPPVQGWPDLRVPLAQALGDRDPDGLAITSGVRSVAAALGARRHVFLETPTFVGVRKVLAHVAARVDRMTWDELLTLRVPVGALVWVTSPARTPDGATLEEAHVAALERLAASGAVVVVNETYCVNGFGAAPAGAGLVRVGTLAKLVGGGTRTGWVSGPCPESLAGSLRGSTPPTVHQLTWAKFLRDEGLTVLRDSMAPALVASADLVDALRPWVVGRPVGWSFLLDTGRPVEPLRHRLEAAGIRCGPGTDFDAPTSTLRLCTSGLTQLDLDRLHRALPILVKETRDHASR